MKKTLSIILAIVMAFAVVPMTAFAEGEECAHTWSWSYFCEGKTEFDCTVDTVKRTGVCSDCAATVTEEINKQSTHFLDHVGTTKAECAKDGAENYECRICTYTTSKTIPAAGHSWGDDEVLVKCFEGEDPYKHGTYIRTCAACGAKDEPKTITNHTYIVMEGAQPTCHKEGRDAYKQCLDCDTVAPTAVIEKLPHVDENGDTKCDLCDGLMAADGSACRCICHNDMDIVQNFLLPILKFLWNLLGMDTCGCGAEH